MNAELRPRPVLGDPAVWRFPDLADHRLANGLRVLAVHLPGKRVATATLLLDMPVDSDPRGQEGLAVLAARSLAEGTQSLAAEAFDAVRENDGLSDFVSRLARFVKKLTLQPVAAVVATFSLHRERHASEANPADSAEDHLAPRLLLPATAS